jgi:hypothetical protein
MIMWEPLWCLVGLSVAILLDGVLTRLVSPAKRDDPKSRQTDVEIGLAVLAGIALGALLGWAAPKAFLPAEPVKGLSRVLLPAAFAVAMHYWGKVRKRQAMQGSAVATWYGGGIFGLGLAIGRLVMMP